MTESVFDRALSQNRAEEFGPDVWDAFVVPPYYHLLDLESVKKPRVIVGGRGCGKTMLLRYLTHNTRFSRKRLDIPPDEVSRIGLYWRADTQFAGAMTKRGIDADVWQAAFAHMAALVLAGEILASVRGISASRLGPVLNRDVSSISFQRLRAFDDDLPDTFAELERVLIAKTAQLVAWVSNIRKLREPLFLPGDAFLRALIATVQEQIPALSQSVFFVYIDEYENLLIQQQMLVNTWIKHSTPPLVFNVAVKRNGIETRETVGGESISEIHDYRSYDVENLDDKFELFAAEILFMRFAETGFVTAVDPAALRDTARLRARRAPDYAKTVLSAAQKMFPQPSQHELAVQVTQDLALRDKLLERITHALAERDHHAMPVRRFFDERFPEASVVVPVLLRRKSLSAIEVADELERLRSGRDNRFTGKTAWIHNNFVGAYLQLYEPLSRPCPLYAGFATFALLARGNIRHFLELCYKALAREEAPSIDTVVVTPERQAEAARQASEALLREVRSFGRLGIQLYAFVVRLGSLFALAHRRPAQSEPEQNHFAIVRGATSLNQNVATLLAEAIKWSVLFEERSTKQKSQFDPEGADYMLNPIYAPYFHISFRKKRRLELSTDDLITIMTGTVDDFRRLMKRYSSKWAINREDAPATLFAGLANADDTDR